MLKTADAYSVMRQVPATMRALTKRASSLEEENTALREKVAHFELRDRAIKVAQEMESKGLNDHLSIEEKVASLLEDPDQLTTREAAVQMAVEQVKLGSPAEGKPDAGANGSQLEAYLMDDDE
jgi:hypothetical protein